VTDGLEVRPEDFGVLTYYRLIVSWILDHRKSEGSWELVRSLVLSTVASSDAQLSARLGGALGLGYPLACRLIVLWGLIVGGRRRTGATTGHECNFCYNISLTVLSHSSLVAAAKFLDPNGSLEVPIRTPCSATSLLTNKETV